MSHNYTSLNGDNREPISLIDADSPSNETPIEPDIQPNASFTTTPGVTSLQPDVIKPQVPVPSSSHMFQINFYRKFFDLDSEQLFQKIQHALNPLDKSTSPASINDDDEDIELYGFIWITGSLIFLMFVSSTGANILSNWLHPNQTKSKYEYDFDLLTNSITLFYGYNLLVPFLLFAYTSWILRFPHRLSLTKVISIYGYTNVLWFPITLINVVIVIFVSNEKHHKVLNLLEWLVVALTGAVTGLSNIIKISPIVHKNALLLAEGSSEKAQKHHVTVLLALAGIHIAFVVAVKLIFFGIKS